METIRVYGIVRAASVRLTRSHFYALIDRLKSITRSRPTRSCPHRSNTPLHSRAEQKSESVYRLCLINSYNRFPLASLYTGTFSSKKPCHLSCRYFPSANSKELESTNLETFSLIFASFLPVIVSSRYTRCSKEINFVKQRKIKSQMGVIYKENRIRSYELRFLFRYSLHIGLFHFHQRKKRTTQ